MEQVERVLQAFLVIFGNSIITTNQLELFVSKIILCLDISVNAFDGNEVFFKCIHIQSTHSFCATGDDFQPEVVPFN